MKLQEGLYMAEIIVSSLGAALSIFLFVFAQGFTGSGRAGVPSAAFFPIVISVILMLLSVYNIIRTVVRIQKEKKAGTYQKPVFVKGKVFQILAVVGLMVLYAILWNLHIGHFLLNSIIVFVPISILLSDETAWWKSAIFTVCLVVFIYVLFSYLLRVRLW